MSTGKIELSVGAVKYVDPNEIITEAEYNYIKNKVPELDERVGVIEGEIDEINSSLDNMEKKVVVSVTDFGANGSDTIDDTQAIQNAINSLTDGGVLKFPYGTYYISNIALNSNIAYVGDNAKIICNSKITEMVTIKNKNNIEINGIEFNGNNLADNVIYLNDTSTVNITKCRIIKGLYYGLRTRKSMQSTIDNCYFGYNGSGDFNHSGVLINGDGILITNCLAFYNNGNGYNFTADDVYVNSKTSINNCRAFNNKRHGFLTNTWCTDFSRTPNLMQFNNCTANFNGEGGQYSGFSIHWASSTVLTSCCAFQNQEHGFVLQDGQLNQIVSCQSRGNLLDGVRLQADFSRPQDEYSGVNNSIINNCVISNNRYGINLEGYCRSIDINSNMFINNKQSPIIINKRDGYTNCHNLFINNNNFRDNLVSNEIVNNAKEEKRIFGRNYVQGIEKQSYTQGETTFTQDVKYIDLVDGSTLPSGGSYFIVSNVNGEINNLNGGYEGRRIILKFNISGQATLKNLNGNLKIGSDFIATNSDIIELIYDSTNYWHQLSRQAL